MREVLGVLVMRPFNLTPRRLEALATLRRLTDQAGAAVHYSMVAAVMRISSWTAYGFLRELETMGLVVRQYAPSGDEAGGRPRILFAATLPVPTPGSSDRLREFYEAFSAIQDEASAATEYLAGAGADIAYHLGFWLSRLRSAGRGAADATLAVLEGGAMPATKIQTVAAMGLGSVLARVENAGLARRMAVTAARLSVLLEDAARLSEDGLASLIDSARLLEQAQPPRRAMP